jgi:pyruvate,orthophosphate dikinase
VPVLALDASVHADRAVLGGKAWGIVRMLQLGVPVPPAFAITTAECTRFHEAGGRVPDDVLAALPDAMRSLEQATGTTFGGGERPLLVSVRSGAPNSMPGMMDTVLNLGTTPAVGAALATLTGDAPFAADLARRFEQQFAHVVGVAPPADPWDQLHAAIAAVFGSWRSRRAVAYRKDRGLAEEGGTAVTIQAMVFGNLDDASGTGVLFTRNPLDGDPAPYGEWLPRGQGEDVVSGSHDPLPLSALAQQLPAVHDELMTLAARLEADARDVQDIEFTVQGGRLWLLQTRAAKRSATAAVRLAVLLEREGRIDAATALGRVTPAQVAALLRSHVEPAARTGAQLLATGRPASPGVVTGILVTDVDEAEERALDGEDIILARQTTNPDDVHAMAVVKGIVTEVGGATSHAAVVSRELDVACVVGCGTGAVTAHDGRLVTLDADTGELLEGALPTVRIREDEDPDLVTMKAWAVAAGGTGASLDELLRTVRERVGAGAAP